MKTKLKYDVTQSERRLVRFVTLVVLATLLIGIVAMSTGCAAMGRQSPPLKHSIRVMNYPMPTGSPLHNTYRLIPKR